MRDVYVVGTYTTAFKKHPGMSFGDLAREAYLGTLKDAGMKTGAPSLGGGPLTTSGGLIFIGAARDSMFRAFETKTGKELWSVKTEYVAHANPITYMGKDGKQYIAIAAGTTFLAYRLP